MGTPRLTEAAIARAIRAARREGCGVVEVRGGAVRILVNETPAPIPSDEPDGGNTCDELFTGASG